MWTTTSAGTDTRSALMTVGPAEIALCIAIALVALLPFADRRGIER